MKAIERIYWVDYAKFFGLILVILAHLYTSEGTNSNNEIRTYIYGFHMPFFFFISGMLFKQRNEGLKFALLKNVKTLLWPYMLFNLLFAVIYGILDGDIYERLIKIPMAVYYGTGNNCKASWFVICLFFIKCIFDVLSYSKIRTIGMLVFIALSLIPFHLQYFYISSTLFGLVFYYLGYLSKQHLSNISLHWLGCILVAIILFVISYFLTKWNGKVSLFGGNVGNNVFLFYCNALIGSMGIIGASLALRNRPNKWIVKASVASIGVVLLHMNFVYVCKAFSKYFTSFELFFFYLGASVIIYIICAILYHITNKFVPVIWGKF